MPHRPLRPLRLIATCATVGILLLFGWLNSRPAEIPAHGGFPLLMASVTLSLTLMALPLFPSLLGEPGRLRRWFALPAGGLRFWFLLAGGFALLLLGTSALVEVMNPEEEQTMVRLLATLTPPQLAVAAVFLCVFTPLIEECLCRGIVLEIARPALALPLSAALFAFAHGLNAFLLPLFFMGWCLGLLTLRTRTLLPAILLHGIFNLVSLCLTGF